MMLPELVEKARSLASQMNVSLGDLNRVIGDVERAMRGTFVRPGWVPLKHSDGGDVALVWDGTCLWYDNRRPGKKPEILRLTAAPKQARIVAADTFPNLHAICTEPWP
jgi:hypothetical protein